MATPREHEGVEDEKQREQEGVDRGDCRDKHVLDELGQWCGFR